MTAIHPSSPLPVLRVHLDDPHTGALSFQLWNKGSKWRKAKTAKKGQSPLDALCGEVDALAGVDHYEIEYVESKR